MSSDHHAVVRPRLWLALPVLLFLLLACGTDGGGDGSSGSASTEPEPETEEQGEHSALWVITDRALWEVDIADAFATRSTEPVAGGSGATLSVRGNRLYLHDGSSFVVHPLDDELRLELADGHNPNHVPDQLSIAPAGETIWVSTANPGDERLIAFSPELDTVWNQSLSKPVVALQADVEDEARVWVLHDAEVHSREESGLVSDFSLGADRSARDVVQTADGTLWVLTDVGVQRYETDGTPIGDVSIVAGNRLHADGHNGVWVADDHEVAHLAEDGSGLRKQTVRLIASGHPDPLRHAAANPRDGSLWLVYGEFVQQADHRGDSRVHAGLDIGAEVIAGVVLYADAYLPELEFVQPDEPLVTNNVRPELIFAYERRGSAIEPESLELRAHGDLIAVDCADDPDAARLTCHPEALADGNWSLTATIADRAGNRSPSTEAHVHVDTNPPPPANVATITVWVADGELLIEGDAGSVEPGRVHVTNTETGQTATVTSNTSGSFSLTLAGSESDDIEIVVEDGAGNKAETTRIDSADYLDPHDPADAAPAMESGVSTTMADRESFLFTGPDPIQPGADTESFVDYRLSVVRGRVTDPDGDPLAGVTVRILGHPEYGYTETRADGQYDLAVNGGGRLTVDFELDGHLPIQRGIDVAWQDYVYTDEVVLLALSDKVTTIDLTATDAGTQVARGPVEEDADGARQATVLFPPGTTAMITDAGGNEITLDEISFRATEYTVGERGGARMPGDLPPSVAYTYAVELSVDEAIAAGAHRVSFSQRIPLYVENFLDFPTGTGVPVGYYDREQGAWMGYDNGAVIEIVDIENGQAIVDVTGEGPATQEELDALHFSVSELQHLAELYEPGGSLQRVALAHFSPWDLNFPIHMVSDVLDEMPTGGHSTETPENEQPCRTGSIIYPMDCTLAKVIPISGTPFSLRYDTRRQDGNASNRRVRIPVTGKTVHEEVERVDVTVTIAGQRHAKSFPPAPDQEWHFEWDGRDVRGREIDSALMDVRLEHVYPQYYSVPDGWQQNQLWGNPPTGIEVSPQNRFAHGETAATRRWTQSVGRASILASAAVGGWSIDVHHFYQSTLHGPDRLEQGSGHTMDVAGSSPVMDTVAGKGTDGMSPGGFSGDGGIATQAELNYPRGMVTDADGALYVSDRDNARVRQIDVNGVITTVAGTGTTGFSGDGGLATEANLNAPVGLAVDPEGNLYIADSGNGRVRRINSDGVIHTVAGNGVAGGGGDGGVAVQAELNTPIDVSIGPDDSLYVVDAWEHVIRRVGPDGIISTIAGVGQAGFSGDGGSAREAMLNHPQGIDVAADGTIHVADSDNARVRRITLDGMIDTVAGDGGWDYGPDGQKAVDTSVPWPFDVAVDAAGNLYIAELWHSQIRRVSPDGLIDTVAGTGEWGVSGDGEAGELSALTWPESIATTPDGVLLIADAQDNRIRSVAYPRLTTADGVKFASPDARQVHEFDAQGRHQSTKSAFTGEVIRTFTYDSFNRLLAIIDAQGNKTRIDRNASGRPVAIVGPNGQRTVLNTNGDGMLVNAFDPEGALWSVDYNTGELMTSFTDRKGATAQYQYNENGELISSTDAEGGGWSLDRIIDRVLVETTMESAEGRVETFRVEHLPEGGWTQSITDTAGLKTSRTRDPGTGRTVILQPDGTEFTLLERRDRRFGMQSPVTAETTVKLPSGLLHERQTERDVTLTDPDNPLSLDEWVETTTVNGRTLTATFTGDAREWQQVSPAGRTSITRLNGQGRPVEQLIGDLAPIRTTYDERGRPQSIIQGEGDNARSLSLAYHEQGSSAGYLASITDPLGRSVQFETDANGRVIEQTLPDGRSIGYDYDAEGNLLAITPPGRFAHLFEYDGLDQRTAYDPPAVEAHGWTTTRYRYNTDRQLTEIERPDNRIITFDHDNGGRLQTRSTDAAVVNYSYDGTTGQLSGITTTDASLAFDHDGFLPTSVELTGIVSGRIDWAWDENFWMVEETVAGRSVEFHHDADGLLTQAGELEITRDSEHGLITGTTLGAITGSRDFNAFGEPLNRSVAADSQSLFDVTYERDALGRITEQTETIDGDLIHKVYSYDEVGRLISVRHNDVPVYQYDYDANGNRTHHAGPDGSVTADYDEQDRLVRYGDTDYTYSQAGDLTEKSSLGGTTTYDYDATGNLRAVERPDGTTIDYLIDGRDRRIGKQVDGTLQQGWLYRDQLNPVAQTDADGNITHRFVYGEKPHVPSYMIITDPDTDSETEFRIVTDHIGSIRLVVNAETGEIAQRIDYDPFGNITTDTNPGFQPFGFAGGIHDHDTGLVRFGARDYDPETGRWTAKDPIGFRGGDTNLYGYAINDPINFIDPNGKFFNVATGLIGAGVGAAVAAATGGSVVQGALTGATAGFTLGVGLAAQVGTGAAAGFATSAFDLCGNFSARDAAIGTLSGALGASLGRFAGVGNGVALARRGAGSAAAVTRARRAQAATEAGASGAAQAAANP